MFRPRKPKLYQPVFLIIINRLVKFQTPMLAHFGFRALKSVMRPRNFLFTLYEVLTMETYNFFFKSFE